jgi:hypothetical protein
MVNRSIVIIALLLAFLGATVPGATASLIPAGRWTVFQVSDVKQDTWSAWYAQGPWPVKYRFTCSNAGIIVNATNTDKLTQSVSATAWDIERDAPTLDRAIASGKAQQNAGFSLPAGQSITFPLYRPDLCAGATKSFVFGAVLGS